MITKGTVGKKNAVSQNVLKIMAYLYYNYAGGAS